MGEPKATEIPAAAAADSTSRLRASVHVSTFTSGGMLMLTLVSVDARKKFHEEARTTARYMDQGTFFAEPQS